MVRDRTPEEAGGGAFRREGPGTQESSPSSPHVPAYPTLSPADSGYPAPDPAGTSWPCPEAARPVRQLAHVRKDMGPCLHSPSGHRACLLLPRMALRLVWERAWSHRDLPPSCLFLTFTKKAWMAFPVWGSRKRTWGKTGVTFVLSLFWFLYNIALLHLE